MDCFPDLSQKTFETEKGDTVKETVSCVQKADDDVEKTYKEIENEYEGYIVPVIEITTHKVRNP